MAYKHLPIITLMAACVGLCSCSNDDMPTETGRQADGAVFVVSGISPATRMTYTDYTESAFDVGDELGACVINKTTETTTVNGTVLPVYEYRSGYNQNVRYKVKAGGTQQLLEPVIPTDIYPTGGKYVFYYPYKVGADITKFSHTVLADQSRQEAFETSDLLRARVNAVTDETDPVVQPTVNEDETISVNMEHVMACIVIKAETGLIDGDVTLLNLYRSVSGIDLTRTLTKEQQNLAAYPTIPGETTQKGDIKMWKTSLTESGTTTTYDIYRAVIPAQEIAAGTPFLTLTFAGNTTAVTYNMSANGSSPLDCHPGNYYLFTVTKDKGLRFAGLINDLDNGGDYYYEY